MITVEIVFLGPSRDLAGVDHTSFDLDDGTRVADLRRVVAERYPRSEQGLGAMRFAVNNDFAADDRILQAGDEVALIPPVSGG